MGQALYRKYRSKNFDEVVGQKHITDTLSRAIKNGRLSHAYLFTGPHGVGKTTIARILAHEVNGLSYDDDSTHLDIIEIDAASNRRIDEIRDLREKVRVSPTSARYKVYIIDEVHMLTREAFNALLKTLEEPPEHVIFVLATTEGHKLPETIVSRTQRFEFRPIDTKSAISLLKKIAKEEEIEIDDEALELLAQHGEGSFRDSIGLLDQLSSHGGKITGKSVSEFLGLPPEESINQLTNALEAADQTLALKTLNNLTEQGISPTLVAANLSRNLRKMIIENSSQVWVTSLLKELIEVPASADPQASLEIALLSSIAPRTTEHLAAKPSTVVKESPAGVKKHTSKTKPPQSGFNDVAWNSIIDEIKSQAASLYTALRLANPRQEGDELILSFEFPLHQKKLEQAKNKELIAKIVAEVTGKNLIVKNVVEKRTAEQDSTNTPQLQAISNIFGQTEMLES